MKKLKYIGCAVLTAMICFGFTISVDATVTNGVATRENFSRRQDMYYYRSINSCDKGPKYSTSTGRCNRCGSTVYGTTEYTYVGDFVPVDSRGSYTDNITASPSGINWNSSLTQSFDSYALQSQSPLTRGTYPYTYSSTSAAGSARYCTKQGCSGYYMQRSVRTNTTNLNYSYTESRYGPTNQRSNPLTKLVNCTSVNVTLYNIAEINGGQYSGTPALNNAACVVTKGVFKDLSNSSSIFGIDGESEATTTKDGTTTITTVKLSNPPPPAQPPVSGVLILIVGFLV